MGQRVAAHTVDVWNNNNGAWETVVSETTIGNKRLHLINPVSTTKVRLVITRARACPLLSSFGLHFYKGEMLPAVTRDYMPMLAPKGRGL